MSDPRYPGVPPSSAYPSYAPVPTQDTTSDEQLARQLQQQFDQEAQRPQGAQGQGGQVVARPVQPTELPFQCGHCGMTHLVRNVSPNAQFRCLSCGATNRLVMQHQQPPVVIVQRGSWMPVPIFCALM